MPKEKGQGPIARVTPPEIANFVNLDGGAIIHVGGRVFYTPTEDEGGNRDYPQGMKFPAVITGVHAHKTGETDPIRGGELWAYDKEDGHPLVSIFIERPLRFGGSLDKERVQLRPNSDTTPGTCRSISTADERGAL